MGPTGAPTLSNGPSFRRGPHSRSLLVNDPSAIPCVTVIVNKDENGYGMKVSGDNPVYVQSVKEGGAAEKAGLHHGDKIIKVNGVNVMQSTHTDVVALIKSATQVALTVQQRPRPASTAIAAPGSHHPRPLQHHFSAPARTTERITPPQPVDNAKQRQLECQRVYTLRLMLEKEQRYVEALRSQMAKCNDTKLPMDLAGAERRVRTLEEEILNLTGGVSEVAAPQQVPGLHTHHRTKSSPDPISMQNLSPAEASKRMLASESMSDLSFGSKRSKGSAGAGFDVDSPHITPPGTPPPPYGGSSAQSESIETLQLGDEVTSNTTDENSATLQTARCETVSPEVSPLRSSCTQQYAVTTVVQHPIISMEDDDMSDQEVAQLDDHGPFKSLSKLWEHTAHLAVFMNYVISNSDSSSLLFYLVTDLYKEGNAKEMRKWAYEIHSSFLVPGAPLRLNNVDENVAREIDDVLLNEFDKEEILRKIFWKARLKAKEELNEQLADFQQKRTAGLGTLFGPPDAQLDESIHDKNKEMKIVENVLLHIIDPYKEDIERDNADIRRFTTAAALATVMSKIFGLRGPHSSVLLDRCPTFVSKDKSLKSRLIGKSRKVTVRGHHFVAHQYYTVTYCNHCHNIICGIGPQGYQCSDCNLNIHRHCVRIVEENCPGPLVKKERGNDRISKLMEKIRPERETRRKPSSHNFVQTERTRRQVEEDVGTLTDGETGSGDRPVGGSRTGERRPDPVRESEERPASDVSRNDDDDHHEITHHVPKKQSVTSINRSESYKERIHQKRQLRERRKTSDPNLSTKNDVDLDNNQGLSYNTNSGSSSNSSLSTRSLDSPSNSLETVSAAAPRTNEAVTVTLTPSSTCLDSDLEAEPDPPDWMQGVDEEVLKTLSSREKKRQEVINELFHTERSHVRNLKVLDQVFYRPMVESQVLPPDHIQLLFSNLDEMLDIHSQFNNGMKNKRRESPLVGDVADLLLSMFDGPASEEFQRTAATFCARQQIALELLKERRRKDSKLNSFLTDAEGNPMCRRLQLKDIIPTAMQRLTKYPLLFESLAKYTSSSPEEIAGVQRAVERSKEILNYVNHSVRDAEDNQRLSDIQKKLDKSGFERVEHPMAGEFKNLDLTKHKLIYEGALTWRIGNRQKLIDLHVLLLDDVIILLQKQDEKYCLKFYNTNAGDRSPTLSPVIKVSTVLVRPNAVDKKALYLVNTSHNGAQIYDLVATTSSERKIWFRHISEAAEAYKTRDGKNRRPEPQAPSLPLSTPDSETPETLHEKSKDSEEISSDGARESNNAPDLLVPPGNSTTQDAESSPSEGTPVLPSTESASSTPQASPSSAQSDGGESITRKMGDGLLSPSPGTQRRRMEPLRLLQGMTTEESPLIQPSEVVVSQRPVLTAEPVLTPIEKLRRKDEVIRLALAEKQQLVADILHVPREEFETIADLAGEPSAHKESSELVLAAVNQVNQLTTVVNDALRVTEEEAVSSASEGVARRVERLPSIPAHQLQGITSALNSHLTQLLKTVKSQDEERDCLRRELQRLREQVHAMHESRRRSQMEAPPSPRPVRVPGSEDDSVLLAGLQRLALKDDASCDEAKDTSPDPHDDATTDVFVDALSGEAESHLEVVEDERPDTEESLVRTVTD